MTRHALVDLESGQIKFELNIKEVMFNVCRSIKQQKDIHIIFIIDIVVEDELVVPIMDKLSVMVPMTIIINSYRDGIIRV